MSGFAWGVAALSVVFRAVAVGWPVLAWFRIRDRRLLILAGLAALLLLEAPWGWGDANPWVSLTVSAVALGAVAATTQVLARQVGNLRRMRESEELNRLTLEAVSDAVFLTDGEGAITHVWPSVAGLFEVDPGTIQPGSSVEVIIGSRFEEVRGLPVGETRQLEITRESNVGRQSGQKAGRRHFIVTVKSVEIQGGRFLFASHEVSDFRHVQTELEEALDEVRRLNARFEAETLYLREEIESEHGIAGIVGASNSLQKTLRAVETVADTDSTVLVRGETGVGKELVARALHELSSRSDRPLVKVNCAALPANLIESELFGHEKGAFTGAVKRKIGRFELADGGTIFLDEIGELPLELQPKLLRVLQEGEFQRVGGSDTIRVDVRVLAATNRNLKDEVDAGRFRSDLYYRIEVFPVEVPSLRERKEDLPLLANHFLGEVELALGRTFDGFTKGSMDAMQSYQWPGNVRELRNVVERAALTTAGSAVDLVPYLTSKAAASRTGTRGDRTLASAERAHIEAVLEDVGWRVEGTGGASDVLGLPPSTLRARMKKLGIHRPAP